MVTRFIWPFALLLIIILIYFIMADKSSPYALYIRQIITNNPTRNTMIPEGNYLVTFTEQTPVYSL